jgi:hypothetical protein
MHVTKFYTSEGIMKAWHWGVIIAVLAGYVLGVMFPSVGNTLKSKITG